MAKVLNAHWRFSREGMMAYHYHGGLMEEEKLKVEKAWRSGDIRCLCSTTAMIHGVDHPNIRYAAFWSVPTSIQTLHQGFGRAGRDGTLSCCDLFYHFDDLRHAESVAVSHDGAAKTSYEEATDRILDVYRFATHVEGCRCKHMEELLNDPISKHGDEGPCGQCDLCHREGKGNLPEEENMLELFSKILAVVREHSTMRTEATDERIRFVNQLWTVRDLCNFLLGNKLKDAVMQKAQHYGCAKEAHYDAFLVERVIEKMVFEKYLRLIFHKYTVGTPGTVPGSSGGVMHKYQEQSGYKVTLGEASSKDEPTSFVVTSWRPKWLENDEDDVCYACGKDGSLKQCDVCAHFFHATCRSFSALPTMGEGKEACNACRDKMMGGMKPEDVGRHKDKGKRPMAKAAKAATTTAFEDERRRNIERNNQKLMELNLAPVNAGSASGGKRCALVAGLKDRVGKAKRRLSAGGEAPLRVLSPAVERETWLATKPQAFQDAFRKAYDALGYWRTYATELCCSRHVPYYEIFDDGTDELALLHTIAACEHHQVQAHLAAAFDKYWSDHAIDRESVSIADLFGDSRESQRALEAWNDISQKTSRFVVPSYDKGPQMPSAAVRYVLACRGTPGKDGREGGSEGPADESYDDTTQSSSASLTLDADGATGAPCLRLTPNHPSVDRGSTVTRRFGAHRFLRVHVAIGADLGGEGAGGGADVSTKRKLLEHLLSQEPRFELGGRKWSYLCGKPLDSQLLFFATESGPGEWPFDELNKAITSNVKERRNGTRGPLISRTVKRTVCDQLRDEIVPESLANLSQAYYKFASRYALGFSSTHAGVLVEVAKVRVIEDDELDGGRATDGAGMMSMDFAKRLQTKLDVKHMPSAFQARVLAFGAKGVWSVVHPWPSKHAGASS